MASGLSPELNKIFEAVPEEERFRLIRDIETQRAVIDSGASVHELGKYFGAWGEEGGREIAEIIEREFERIPEE